MKKIFIKHKAVIPLIVLMLIGTTACAAVFQNREERKEQARTLNELGSAYLKSAEFTLALKEFTKAEALTPEDPVTHYHLGIAHYGMQRNERASAEFKKAIDLKPDYSEAHNYLGSIYLGAGLYDRAIEEFNLAISSELYETPDIALNNMGWAYFKKGNHQRALTTLSDALLRNPNTRIPYLIHKNMGVVCLADNDVESAIYHLEESVRIASYIAESHYWLGMSYIRKNDINKALEEFQRTVELSPESTFGRMAKKQINNIQTGTY